MPVSCPSLKSIPYAYLAFEGEGHGFRGAFAQRRTLEARISFLGQVFGFEPADDYEPLEMPGLDAWLARHPRRVAAGATSGAGPGPVPPATDEDSGAG